MKSRILVAMSVAASALALAGCDVDKTEEGEMPDVDVEGGNLPEYDVEGPDVDVGTEEKTITVPDVDVDAADEDEEPDPDE
jgi:predicted small secreted protein